MSYTESPLNTKSLGLHQGTIPVTIITSSPRMASTSLTQDAFVNTRPRHTKTSTQVTFSTTQLPRSSVIDMPVSPPADQNIMMETSNEFNELNSSTRVDRPIIYNMHNLANLKSWNIKFSGDSCVYEFLNRVEETRAARDVDTSIVLRGLSELLQGTALQFYRQIRSRITSWSDVCREFKQNFQPVDFDYTTEKTIRETKQKDSQSVFAFIVHIKDLNSKLANPIQEQALLEIVKHNLLPCYASLLANNAITSFEQLILLGRNYEAYVAPTTSSKQNNTIGSPKEPFVHKNPPFCTKCKRRGHDYSQCRVTRKIQCYKCGTPNVYTNSCPKCNGPRPTQTNPRQTRPQNSNYSSTRQFYPKNQ